MSTQTVTGGIDWEEREPGRVLLVSLALWMGAVSAFLLLTGQFTVELFFVHTFIALLVMRYLYTLRVGAFRWGILRWVLVACLVAFAYLIAQRVITVLG